jgi:tetratricopeptide (TPR) repeat protein
MFWQRKQRQQEELEDGFDVVVARRALEQGDLAHAAHHIANALATDPVRRDWLALLDEAIARAGPSALDLAPDEPQKETYFGIVAVRAYILARIGRLAEAVSLLLQVIRAKPDVPYVQWLLWWKDLPGFAQALNPQHAGAVAAGVASRFPEFAEAPEADRRPLEQVAQVMALATWAHPDEPMAWSFRSITERKLGRLQEALAIAQEGQRHCPAYFTAVALSSAYRQLGNRDAAIAAMRAALDYQPDDAAARNDIADMLHDAGRVQEAADWYKQALDREPNQDWAAPSYLYCMHLLYPDAGWDRQLEALAAQRARDGRARDLRHRLQLPFVGLLPPIEEAYIKVMAQALEQTAAKGTGLTTMNVALSCLESPSARLAVDLELARVAPGARIDLQISSVPEPDTRQPLRPVDVSLWRYDGMTPIAAVAPPPTQIASAIAAIAQTRYGLELWRAPAQRLAGELGPGGVQGLLGVMVHPPHQPTDEPAWDWLRKVQIAAAMTIARLDGSWAESVRRRALVALAYGPMDWSGAAAVLALGDLAETETGPRRDIERLLVDLAGYRPSGGAWALSLPMVVALLLIPRLGEDGRAALQRLTNEVQD